MSAGWVIHRIWMAGKSRLGTLPHLTALWPRQFFSMGENIDRAFCHPHIASAVRPTRNPPVGADATGITQRAAIGTACAAPGRPAAAADKGTFDADAAIEASGDELNVQGFDVTTFTSLACGYLKINSVWATVADLTIFRNGTVDFDYHCFDGNPHDPGEMTAITLAILHDDDRGGEAARYPHLSFLFSIARAALEQGLSVELRSNDPSNAYWRIKDEVAVTNPDRPEHGTIRVTDDGALWWRCQLRDQPSGRQGSISPRSPAPSREPSAARKSPNAKKYLSARFLLNIGADRG